jgi:hypothetical protein
MTGKEQFEAAAKLKSLREQKQNRLDRIAQEQECVNACDADIHTLLETMTTEEIANIESLLA